MSATWTPLYEHHVDENAEIELHQLCTTCAKFRQESRLLRSLFRGKKIKLSATESFRLCNASALKAGYLNGCHLCAMLWARAEGHLFDPDKPEIEETDIILDLQARNFSMEYNMETQSSALGNLWWKHVPPSIHIWGADPTTYVCLTKDSLEDFQSEILLSSLPAKYQEAIRITRALGFHYLWIDSLCIIQDSDEDWAKEALNMASVYGRTACNLSFVYPPSDQLSKKHLRDPRLGIPCQVFQSDAQNGSGSDAVQSTSLVIQNVPGFISRFWSPNTYKDYWPLLSRAWAIQERLLCSRNLYFGQDRLMWECCEMVEDEFWGLLDNSARSKSRFYAIFAGIDSDSGSHSIFESFKGQWCHLIEEYRIAELSYEEDRIIAFAGIVGAIQSHTQFTYLAGIWKEFAELGLLWVTHPPPPMSDFYTSKVEPPPAPSWSWFKVPPYAPLAAEDRDTINFHLYSAMHARAEHTIYKMRVVSVEHPKLATEPNALLHDFSGLSITLKTRKIPTTLEWDEKILRLLPLGRHQLSRSHMDPKNGMHYVHDEMHPFPDFPAPVGAFMILTMLEAWIVRDDQERTYKMADWPKAEAGGASRTLWQYAGLVVVRAGQSSAGKDRWKRIGAFMFSDFVDGQGIIDVPFAMTEEEEEVVLI
ncbi:hypothetical protein G7Z17_g8097 [Cylindrodendrum hubeiense]|uniref:Heterokaryon incompatibility domain-containing protein n=1 Tax=Cylindrodendrum hubeiense TaxID=595255 RepID=A0A9P5LDI6_9HYPO|nr:hypothetical protein G7Z17_g8097 [Cylindrodendrum hubeiense]